MRKLTPLELRLFRLQRGLGQAQIAPMYGVSPSHYSQAEAAGSGKTLGFERLINGAVGIAPGEPADDEQPLWSVCRVDVPTGEWVVIPESRKRRKLERVPRFYDGEEAERIAERVAEANMTHAIRALPFYRTYVAVQLAGLGLEADAWYPTDDDARSDDDRVRDLGAGLHLSRKLVEVGRPRLSP